MTGLTNVVNTINFEKQVLFEKLQKLDTDQRANIKTNRKGTFEPLKQSLFINKNPKLKGVQSKVDYDLAKEKQRILKEKLEQTKMEMDLDGCTFQPKLINKNHTLLASYVSVVERPLPRKEHLVEKTETVMEEEQTEPNKTNRRYNQNFYQEQMDWRGALEETKLKKRLEKEETLQYAPPAQPVTNRDKNKLLVKREPDFLDRVQGDLERAKLKMGKLEATVYDSDVYTFAPKTLKRLNVQSKIHKK